MSDEIKVPTAGYHDTRPELLVRIGKTSCGHIEDGVAMRFANQSGGFIVSWYEFEAAYKANLEARSPPKPKG